MLNQNDKDARRRIRPVTHLRCVGEPPVRWDVGLGSRLVESIKGLFWRDRGERAFPIQPLPRVAEGPTSVRKAA